MNNLVDHAVKDHGFTRENVMKPGMHEKLGAKHKFDFLLLVYL